MYEDWRAELYPAGLPKRRWLELYAATFPAVEVNNSFYRLPSVETFARWRDETPQGFTFAVKASRYVTHIRRLRDCAEAVELFWSRAGELGPKLGPVLFQLPPRFRADPDLLAGFLGVLPPGMGAAFEFRDPSWHTDDVQMLLDRHGAALVMPDRPGERIRDVVTGGWSYLRFHQGRADRPDYSREKLRRWAKRIALLPAREIHVYFNNDTGGAAVRDARTLAELLLELGAVVASAA